MLAIGRFAPVRQRAAFPARRLCPLLCVFGMLGLPAVAAEGPEIPASCLEAAAKRLDRISTANARALEVYLQSVAKLRNKEADAELLYQQQLGKVDLGCHRELLMLARDLAVLAAPAPVGGPGGKGPPAKVLELRREIAEAERARVVGALESDGSLTGDERAEKAIYRKEMALDSLFDREAARPVKEIEAARRGIAREKKQRLPDTGKIAAMEKQIETARQTLDGLYPLYFGHPARAGFDYSTGLPAGHPAEALRLRILECAGQMSARLAKHSGTGGENGGSYGEIGGTCVYSENLGVVLDVSGSMTSFIGPLKKEIAKSFSGPRYREVKGCSLGLVARRAAQPPEVEAGRDTLAVVEELITVHKVDTVYWFCDLQDTREVAALRRLRHLLRRGGVALHVKSVDRSPDRELEPLLTSFKR